MPLPDRPSSSGRAGGRPKPGPAGRRGIRGRAKALAWLFLGFLVRGGRLFYAVVGRTQSVDTIVYKADRLGDWLLAEPTLERIADSVRRRGGSVIVWAATEADAARAWRRPAYHVETFALEPKGLAAKLRRAVTVAALLSRYRSRVFVSLRYSPEPVRDFVLAHVRASDRYALSWLIYDGPTGPVPHEIIRHEAVLRSLGLAPPAAAALLPRGGGWSGASSREVVLTPYSSTPLKDWEDGHWREIISVLVKRGLRVGIWVGPGQRKRAEGLLAGLVPAETASAVGVKSGTLGELAAAVGSARLVLTVDTVTAHLAAADDAPMVCLLGGGQYGDFGPWRSSPRQRWMSRVLPCYGCDWRCTRPSVECLQGISTSAVTSEVVAALDGTG